jgi:hypothetical protein
VFGADVIIVELTRLLVGQVVTRLARGVSCMSCPRLP